MFVHIFRKTCIFDEDYKDNAAWN